MPEDIDLTNHCLEGLTDGIVSYCGNPTKDLSPDHLYQIRGFQDDAENFPSGFVCVEDCHTRKILFLPFSYTLYFRKPTSDTTGEQSQPKCMDLEEFTPRPGDSFPDLQLIPNRSSLNYSKKED